MPQADADLLPGIQGRDYHFVRYGGRIYVVYSITFGGHRIPTGWRVDPKDLDAFHVNRSRIKKINRQRFSAINVFGNADEIRRRDDNAHPWTKYLSNLRELYGHVSWLQDEEFMSVMLMGWFEQWSDVELQQRLRRTEWYGSRTDWARQWELEMNPAQREATIQQTRVTVDEVLRSLYGPAFDMTQAGIDDDFVKSWSEKIARGEFGTPEDGINFLLSKQRKIAEQIVGTTAWMELQQGIEEQRQFANRPENMAEQLRADALVWLGPNGVPSSDVVRRWAGDLVSGSRSEADWVQFLRREAQALYPFLDTDEPWQDRASSYKQIAEQQIGSPIEWDDPLLGSIGARDSASGAFTGAAMPYDEFTKVVRSTDRFWGGSVSREEGFGLYGYLQNVFQGVQ